MNLLLAFINIYGLRLTIHNDRFDDSVVFKFSFENATNIHYYVRIPYIECVRNDYIFLIDYIAHKAIYELGLSKEPFMNVLNELGYRQNGEKEYE